MISSLNARGASARFECARSFTTQVTPCFVRSADVCQRCPTPGCEPSPLRNFKKKISGNLKAWYSLSTSYSIGKVGFMSCSSCQSSNQAEFSAEINVHFPGPQNLTKPTVWVFPKILVCFDCGLSTFLTPKDELARLAGPEPSRVLGVGPVR